MQGKTKVNLKNNLILKSENIEYNDNTLKNHLDKEINIVTDGEPVKAGYKVDGKDVYIKRINLGTLPEANSGKSVADGLEHTKIIIIKIEGFATNTSGDYQNTLSGYDTRFTVNPNGLSISIKNENYTAFTGVADIYYINK